MEKKYVDASSKIVTVGDIVKIRIYSEDGTFKREMSVKIVDGDTDASMVDQMPLDSPIAKAIIGKETSCCSSYKVNGKTFHVTILNIVKAKGKALHK